jgi:hypothetical protein
VIVIDKQNAEVKFSNEKAKKMFRIGEFEILGDPTIKKDLDKYIF